MHKKIDHPWLKSYPETIRWDFDFKPSAVPQILEDAVAKWPHNPVIDFMGRRFTYRELGALTDRGAKGLQALGVGPGVHVGIFLPNSPHTIVAFFSILKAGGTVVNYSPLDAAQVLQHKIDDSETDFLFTLELASFYPQMAGMLGKTRLKKLVVGNLAEMSGDQGFVDHEARADVSWDDRHMSLADLLDNDGDYERHPLADPADAIAVLQYTGGTTGLPKGAMLTHGNLTAACAQIIESTKLRPAAIRIRGRALSGCAAAVPHLCAHRQHAVWHQAGCRDRAAPAL